MILCQTELERQSAGGKSSKTQGTEKTSKSAMTDGFIERIKAYAKEDAKRGEYMSAGFTQMRLAHMEKYVSPDRSGPKDDVMSAIQAALNEPHPMLQALEKMLENCREDAPQILKSFPFSRPPKFSLLTARTSQATTALVEVGRIYRPKKNINSLAKQPLFTYRHSGKLAQRWRTPRNRQQLQR